MKKILSVLSVLLIMSSCGGGYNPPDIGKKHVVADFLYENQHPLTVIFHDESLYSDAGVKWNFGDGSTSDERNPVHRYKTKGVYNVTMTARSFQYGSDTKTITITVKEPTTCYVIGVVIESVPKNNEYYNIRFTDDYLFFETLYWKTNWELLSSANIPYNYSFKNKYKIDFSNSEYIMRLCQSSSASGDGKEIAAWSIKTDKIKKEFSQKISGSDERSKVSLLLEWQD